MNYRLKYFEKRNKKKKLNYNELIINLDFKIIIKNDINYSNYICYIITNQLQPINN